MKRVLLIALVALSITGFAAATDDDEAALLDLHAIARRAHLEGNAGLMGANVAEELWDSSGGKVKRIPRQSLQAGFSEMFKTRKYSRWDDVEPPKVFFSPDRRMAWMIVHIQAQISYIGGPNAGSERRFESSWIAVHQKRDGKWLLVGIASSVADLK